MNRVPTGAPLGAFSPPPPPALPPRIYLTGFMASGKSTVGPLLADRLGYRFIDLDWMVEARTGRSVLDLFQEGEAAFRAAEAEALTETTRGSGIVVATGGGTLAEPGNLVKARMAGPVVWLRAAPATISDRLGDAPDRPVLADDRGTPLQGRGLTDRVHALLSAREPYYAQADRVVDADPPAEAVARAVAESLRDWRR